MHGPTPPSPYIAYVIHILVGGVEEHDLSYDMDGYDMDMGLIFNKVRMRIHGT